MSSEYDENSKGDDMQDHWPILYCFPEWTDCFRYPVKTIIEATHGKGVPHSPVQTNGMMAEFTIPFLPFKTDVGCFHGICYIIFI